MGEEAISCLLKWRGFVWCEKEKGKPKKWFICSTFLFKYTYELKGYCKLNIWMTYGGENSTSQLKVIPRKFVHFGKTFSLLKLISSAQN